MKKFMLDIESTGVDIKSDEILQVAFLECNFDGKFWVPGDSLQFQCHSDRQPESEFARTYMAAVYEASNAAAKVAVADRRAAILYFFRSCGAEPPQDVSLVGQNSIGFDVPFLVRDGYLQPNRYEQVNGRDTMVGDFHYRQLDLNSVRDFVTQLTGQDAKDVVDIAMAMKEGPAIEVKARHTALSDCFRQLRLWNGLMAMVRRMGK